MKSCVTQTQKYYYYISRFPNEYGPGYDSPEGNGFLHYLQQVFHFPFLFNLLSHSENGCLDV